MLSYCDKPLVSVDYNHIPFSCNFDSLQTRVNGSLVKVMAWYDNEWGFSNRMLDNSYCLARSRASNLCRAELKFWPHLGPGSSDDQGIRELIIAGVNVFRLNFSHGSAEEHTQRAATIRRIGNELKNARGYSLRYAGAKNSYR